MNNVELLELVLAVSGIAIAIYFGVRGENSSQNQKSGKNSTTIQSGRDTNINDKP